MEKQYCTQLYNPDKVFFPQVALVLLMPILCYIIPGMFTPRIVSCMFVLVLIEFFLFRKFLRNRATTNATFDFNDDEILIKEHNKNNFLIKETLIPWRKMRGFRYYCASDKVNHVILYWNGGKRDFGIQDGLSEEESFSKTGFLGIFNDFRNRYNSQSNDNIIVVEKPFLYTKNGLRFIQLLALFFVTSFVIHLIYAPKTSFLTLFVGLIFLLNSLLVRKMYGKRYKELVGKLG